MYPAHVERDSVRVGTAGTYQNSLAIPQLWDFIIANFKSSSFGLIRPDHNTKLSWSDVQLGVEEMEPATRRKRRPPIMFHSQGRHPQALSPRKLPLVSEEAVQKQHFPEWISTAYRLKAILE